ncbi:epoxyqueuosine reductase QueH [Candidatus Beckwithbacteria bacterium]|nr:epoxyqueuosine reductase QueH [Candidatus Beckwithbacteria bacterium]
MFLLHTCCADCAFKLLDSIENETAYKKEEVVLYFYNPNIHPLAEHLRRQKAVQKMFPNNQIIIESWHPQDYFEALKDLDSKVQAKRCSVCWQLRLQKTFAYAQEHDFKIVSSTLFSSKYQNFGQIQKIGEDLAQKYKVKFFIPQKIEREKVNKGFYKQNFCGCCYSLVERLEEKYWNLS